MGPEICPPETTITSGPAGTIYTDWTSFRFSSSESGSTFECKLDGETFGSCTSPKPYTALSDGSHTFQVRAKDPQGNFDSTPESHTWTVDTTNQPPPDTTPPQTSITSAPWWHITNRTISFGFEGSDDRTVSDALNFECRLNGDPKYSDWKPCTAPEEEYTDVIDGTHTFQVRAIDSSNNYDPTPESREKLFDSTAPDTKIESGPSDPSNDSTPTFEFYIVDNAPNYANFVSGFTCKYYPSSLSPEEVQRLNNDYCRSANYLAPGPSTYTLPELSDGTYTFEVTARDGWNRPDPTPATYTWTFKAPSPPPNTSITKGPDEGSTTDADSATFEFSSDQNDATFECKLDNDAWESDCSSPQTYNNLSDGQHTFQVRATNSAGNVEDPPVSRTWTIEGTPPPPPGPPDTAISSPTPGQEFESDASVSASFNVVGSAIDDTESFECNLDSGGWKSCGTRVSQDGNTFKEDFGVLSSGSHNLQVRATNSAGTDASPPSVTFKVKDAPTEPVIPHVTVTDPTNGATGVAKTTKPTVTFDTDLKSGTVNSQNVKLQIYNAKKKKWVTVPSSSATKTDDPTVIEVTPTSTLGSQKKYRVVVNTKVESSTDKNLEQPFSFKFTTRK